MTDETQVENGATENPETNSSESKVNGFSQDEVNKIVADRVARERKKFEGIDIEQYHQWQQDEENRKLEDAKKRGEYEDIIKNQADKFNTRIAELETTLKREKVDGALLGAASKLKSVAPTQVVDLLKGQVRLNEQGEAEVVDVNGTPAYKDDGSAMNVDDLVKNFLTSNPHFAAPSASGTGTESKIGGGKASSEIDVSKLDMSNREDRAKYSAWRKENGYEV